MNRECYGHWVEPLGLYRCLLDGQFVGAEHKPKICPNCERKVKASVILKPKLRAQTITEVFLGGHYGWIEVARSESKAVPCPRK
jgi:hypothetical protein